jgi:hypothetical protein
MPRLDDYTLDHVTLVLLLSYSRGRPELDHDAAAAA